jgi:hypothetical protein
VCGGGGGTTTFDTPQLAPVVSAKDKFNLGISFLQSRIWQSCMTNLVGTDISWDSKKVPPHKDPWQRRLNTMSSSDAAAAAVAAPPKGRVVLPSHVVPIRCVRYRYVCYVFYRESVAVTTARTRTHHAQCRKRVVLWCIQFW